MIKGLFKISQRFSSSPYSKFKVSRNSYQSIILFLKNQSTVSQLLNQIKQNFKVESNILIASSSFQPTLLGFPVLPQAEKATKDIGEQSLIPLLLSGQLYIYQAALGKVELCYSISCEQFNSTNNRNLPERIANGIVQLNNQWLSAKTIGDALNSVSIPNPKDKETIQDRQQLRSEVEKAHSTLIQLNKFKIEGYRGSPLNVFAIRMITIMSINWAFLFAVTYGKYGWDVGQPISYLSAVGVDLAALVGFFDLQEKLQERKLQQRLYWENVLNLQNQKKLQSWLLSYYRRQLY